MAEVVLLYREGMDGQIEVRHGDVDLYRAGHNHWVFLNGRWHQLSSSIKAVDALIRAASKPKQPGLKRRPPRRPRG